VIHRKIVNEIVNDLQYKRFCKKLCKGNKTNIHEDLYQEFILAILEYNTDNLVYMYDLGKIKFLCLSIIFNINRHRIKPSVFNPDRNPLYELCKNTQEINKIPKQDVYNVNIDLNAIKVLDYVSKDKSIKVEDWLLLVESLDRTLIDISRESGIPYITLKVKSKRLKDKIRNNVNI